MNEINIEEQKNSIFLTDSTANGRDDKACQFSQQKDGQFEININSSKFSNASISPLKNKKVKQFENILNQKMINLQELKSLAWNGIPNGKDEK